jgi:hypothetical protein
MVSSLIHDVWDCPPTAAYLNTRRALAASSFNLRRGN